MNSRRQFIFEGLKQAGLVLLTVFLLGVLILFGLHHGIKGKAVGKLFVFIVSTLGGLSQMGLFHLDISNKSIEILWLLLIFPYWAGLGVIVGLLT